MWQGLLLIVLLCVIFLSMKQNGKIDLRDKGNNVAKEYDVNGVYAKKNLLTKAEYSFWKILYIACEERKFIICPKVRMEDFLSIVKTEKKEIMRYRGYIKSRHIDFIICDNALHILAGIELDDNSHKKDDVKKVDDLKNQIFKNINVPLYRVSMSEGKYQEQIDKILLELENKNLAR